MLSRSFFLFVIISLLNNCKNKNSDNLVIKLDNSSPNNIAFRDSYSEFPFQFFYKKYPTFYKSQILKYKNLPDKDFYLVFAFTDHNKFLYELHSENLIANEKYVELSRRLRLDSLVEQNKPKQHLLTAISGYKDGKQYLMVDTNQDYDFGDETTVQFNFNPENQAINIPVYNYEYNWLFDEIKEEYVRNISIIPASNKFYFQHEEDSAAKKLGIIGKFNDYWKGEINVNGSSKYDIAIQGYNRLYSSILIKHDSMEFSSLDAFFNESFQYKLNDTIKLSNSLYVLDSLGSQITKIYLSKLEIKPEKVAFGWRIGDVVNDFQLITLDGRFIPIASTNKNKYTLLDFWGTWCPPCREMTPGLKKIYHNFGEKVEIVGVAYDKSKSDVQDYAKNNQLDWEQTFINFKERDNRVLKYLNVNAFPTLILIDSNKKIVFRGSDYSALGEVEKILTNTTNSSKKR